MILVMAIVVFTTDASPLIVQVFTIFFWLFPPGLLIYILFKVKEIRDLESQ